MLKKHVENIIIGAGVSGLAAGIELKKCGNDCLILEKEKSAGGLCRTIKVGGCDFDFGPKILILDDSENSKKVLSYLKGNYNKYPISESVYLNEYGFLKFPLQRHLYCLPDKEKNKILRDIEKSMQAPKLVTNYKDWLENGFGKYFCEKVLFPYEEKKWQTRLESLDYKWALDRPIKVDYDEIKQGALFKLPPKGHYYYPRKGSIQSLINNMLLDCCPIKCNQEVLKINLKSQYIETKNTRYYYKRIISTLPINLFLKITNSGAKQFPNSNKILQGLGILVVNLVFKGSYNLQGTALYFPEKEYVFRRVSILQNLCPALARRGYTSIQVEVSVKKGCNINRYVKKVLNDLKKIEQFFILGEPTFVDHMVIGFAYPLPKTGLEEYVKNIHKYFALYDIYHCGRGGNYLYCNLDKAYKLGVDIVQKVITQKK